MRPYYSLAFSAPFAHSRYHLPAIPLLCVYAAAAIVHGRDIWLRRRSLAFVLSTALCVIVVLGWLREIVFVDYGMLGG